MTRKNIHEKTLESIINLPSIIEEDLKDINFIFKEPIWLHHNSNDKQKMCDLIIGYKNHAIPVEIKGTENYRHKALMQVEQGKKFIKNELGLFVPYGKIVYYAVDKCQIYFETIS